MAIELFAHRGVVLEYQVTPPRIPHTIQRCSRTDDIGEQERRDHAAAHLLGRNRKSTGRAQLDAAIQLVSHDPRIVTWRDFVGIAGLDVRGRSIGHLDVKVTGRRVADVANLAGVCPRDGFDVSRPASSRL